ncbi:Membrane protease YdiL, CAAX protease family [Halovenus aranensis]|uniref:Membrane protease YdiL, CAAX protease family n=1 Tax=Halovenus aranensis TaxID=890420 RepID=A0A1G8XI51_9EURY|nr:type II CAAX endopeptidase family protein [Halovenus aranensis]SDJ90153.1 Membrane protease YdiL, CAAX protease family [Halovenus aranensis]
MRAVYADGWRSLWESRLGRLACVTGAVALALVLGEAVVWLVGRVVAVGDAGTLSNLLVGVAALQVVGFGGVVALAVRRHRESWRSVLGVEAVTEWTVFYGTATGLAMMVVASLATGVFAVLDVEAAESSAGAADDPLFYMVLFVVSTLVVVPLEEAFFRGFVQGQLEEQFHSAVAIVVASGCFVVVHANVSVGSGGEPVVVGLFFSLGVVLGVSYTMTKHLAVPIIGHAVFNGAQILVQTLEVLV